MTTSEFTISQTLSSEGSIQLFDISGKKIRELFRGDFGAHKNIRVRTDGIVSGVYLVKVRVGNQFVAKRLVIK